MLSNFFKKRSNAGEMFTFKWQQFLMTRLGKRQKDLDKMRKQNLNYLSNKHCETLLIRSNILNHILYVYLKIMFLMKQQITVKNKTNFYWDKTTDFRKDSWLRIWFVFLDVWWVALGRIRNVESDLSLEPEQTLATLKIWIR